MSDIIKFNFHGDSLDVIQDAGDVWVSVKRVCDVLGVAEQPQYAKLRGNQAATTTIIVAVADDGKNRAMLFISVRSLPLWLATIHPSKVSDGAREKLIAYQREAAEVLADHFLGKRYDLSATNVRLGQLEHDLRDAKNALLLGGGMICGMQREQIRSAKRRAADFYVRAGLALNLRSAFRTIQNGVNNLADWGGAGQRDELLPVGLFTRVLAHLEGEQKKALKVMKIREQPTLPGVGNVVPIKRGRRGSK